MESTVKRENRRENGEDPNKKKRERERDNERKVKQHTLKIGEMRGVPENKEKQSEAQQAQRVNREPYTRGSAKLQEGRGGSEPCLSTPVPCHLQSWTDQSHTDHPSQECGPIPVTVSLVPIPK